MYHNIDEEQARIANSMNSHYPFEPGRATEHYKERVDLAVEIGRKQKLKVAESYHAEIDRLVEMFSKKLADVTNRRFKIECICPSVLISGAGNFPVRKKEKQNKARDANQEEYNKVKKILDKIESVGTSGISSDDPEALDKLRIWVEDLETEQERMKKGNSYYRKHKTMRGFHGLSDEQADRFDSAIPDEYSKVPFPPYVLANNRAAIYRIQDRIKEIERLDASPTKGWAFDGGEIVINVGINRLQVFFESKPAEDMRKKMRLHGFKWSSTQGAWQRQYTENAIRSARQIFA